MRATIWTIDSIEQGIMRYQQETGHYPNATDFDECPYLPSARQIQRKFGGMEKLGERLGIAEINYTKGNLRRAIYDNFSERSLDAEDKLEMALIAYFGEPYVHTQKRYYRLMKNRWDFFVYCQDGHFGIDIFSTARQAYIMNNIRHKLPKYADVPSSMPIYFVVDAPTLSDIEIGQVVSSSLLLQQYPNIHIISFPAFLRDIMPTYVPLTLPDKLKLVLDSTDIEQK